MTKTNSLKKKFILDYDSKRARDRHVVKHDSKEQAEQKG